MKDPFEDTNDEAGAHDYSDGPPVESVPVPRPVGGNDLQESPTPSLPRPVAPSEGKVVVTLKGGRDFDAPWIVIHAADAADALNELSNTRLKALIEQTHSVASFFAGLGGSSAAPARSAPSTAAPQGATAAPSWMPPPPAPDWVYKSGVTKSGRNAGQVYHAWAPAKKGGGEWQFHDAP